jgi:hypothetical protein
MTQCLSGRERRQRKGDVRDLREHVTEGAWKKGQSEQPGHNNKHGGGGCGGREKGRITHTTKRGVTDTKGGEGGEAGQSIVMSLAYRKTVRTGVCVHAQTGAGGVGFWRSLTVHCERKSLTIPSSREEGWGGGMEPGKENHRTEGKGTSRDAGPRPGPDLHWFSVRWRRHAL